MNTTKQITAIIEKNCSISEHFLIYKTSETDDDHIMVISTSSATLDDIAIIDKELKELGLFVDLAITKFNIYFRVNS